MCTLILLRRPGHEWPTLLAANRDERLDRPWLPPARHWPEQPQIIGGVDQLAGGSWLALNDDGLVAAVMNRRDSLGPAEEFRSRGELVLEALDHAEATEAAAALEDLEPRSFRPFNLVICDARSAFWLRHRDVRGPGIERFELPAGLSMITAYDRNDTESPRISAYLPRFRNAPAPQPDRGEWSAWELLLASRQSDADVLGAMNLVSNTGFGTLCSSLIALPAPGQAARNPVMRFAAGRPDVAPFRDIRLTGGK